jgi:hypothetical protein
MSTVEIANHAIRAAVYYKQWGAYAARRYCEKRNVHPRLLQLARQLEAVKGFAHDLLKHWPAKKQ